MCIVSIITHHQEYTICTSINHPHRHTGRRQRWRRSQIIYLLEEQILPQKLNAKIIFDTVIIIKSLLSLFKINKDRTVIFDAKKRRTTFLNAIKINYFNSHINKKFKVDFFFPQNTKMA